MALFSVHTADEERRTAAAIYEDADFTGTFVNIFLFHLLRARPASDDFESNTTVREAVRLGLLLFLACLKRRFGLYPVTFKIHIEKLIATLSGDQKALQELNHLRLWIIAMGLLEAIDEAYIVPLAEEWRKSLKEEGIKDPSQAEDIVKDVMWIGSIHGTRYREVQERFWRPAGETALPPSIGCVEETMSAAGQIV